MQYYNTRNNFRNRNSDGSIFSRYSITTWIIIFTFIISIIGFVFFLVNPDRSSFFILQPDNILAGRNLWTIVLHIFVHGNILHLAINMFALYSLGGLSEQIIGRKRFLWFYLLAGIFAGLLSVLLAGYLGFGFWERLFGSPNVGMVGASGAIFGIAGLFVILLPKVRFSIIFLPFFSLPAYIMVPIILVLTWAATIAANLPIGNTAHFGGFLAGLVYGYYLRVKYRRKVQILDRHFR